MQRTGTFTMVTAVAVVALVAGCGGDDPAEGAESVIETEIEEQIDLGELEATCDEPDERVEGEEFSCTATTEDGRTIEFIAEFTSDDEIFVGATNALRASDVTVVLEAVVISVNEQIEGAQVVVDDFDCGEGTLILDDQDGFDCEITDTTDGAVYAFRIDTGGIVDGEPANLSWELGDPL